MIVKNFVYVDLLIFYISVCRVHIDLSIYDSINKFLIS